MKIQLKKIKHLQAASQETFCFSADLYIEGSFVCTTSNSGNGEANRYDMPFDKVSDIERACTKNLSMDLETICFLLVEYHVYKKQVGNLIRRSFLLVEDGKAFSISRPAGVANNVKSAMLERIQGRYPGAKILNNLTLSEATDEYIECLDEGKELLQSVGAFSS